MEEGVDMLCFRIYLAAILTRIHDLHDWLSQSVSSPFVSENECRQFWKRWGWQTDLQTSHSRQLSSDPSQDWLRARQEERTWQKESRGRGELNHSEQACLPKIVFWSTMSEGLVSVWNNRMIDWATDAGLWWLYQWHYLRNKRYNIVTMSVQFKINTSES